MKDKAIVLLSGGQDSTTCLLMAIDQYGSENVYPVCFSYNQKHLVELDQARVICGKLNTKAPIVFPIEALAQLGGGALTNAAIEVGTVDEHRGMTYHERHNLPSTVVPGRNLMFLTIAAAYGANIDCYTLVTGGCQADFAGYPDCRPAFYAAAEEAIGYALDEIDAEIWTPLVRKSKAETFAIADELGYLDLIINDTHTCYNGVRDMHDWGAGCGECPACKTRAQGWYEFQDMKATA